MAANNVLASRAPSADRDEAGFALELAALYLFYILRVLSETFITVLFHIPHGPVSVCSQSQITAGVALIFPSRNGP